MTTRYRINDRGFLIYYNDGERKWLPIDCSEMLRYCGLNCKYFKVKDNNVVLKCVLPYTEFAVEE